MEGKIQIQDWPIIYDIGLCYCRQDQNADQTIKITMYYVLIVKLSTQLWLIKDIMKEKKLKHNINMPSNHYKKMHVSQSYLMCVGTLNCHSLHADLWSAQ